MKSSVLRVAVIGVGNEYRGDDGAGLAVARKLAENTASIRVIELPGEGTEIIDAMSQFDEVFLIDASRSGNEPGTVREFNVSEVSLPVRFFNYSTHAFGLAEAIEVSRALGSLPASVTVFSIEGINFDAGQRMSSQVLAGVNDVVARIAASLQRVVTGGGVSSPERTS